MCDALGPVQFVHRHAERHGTRALDRLAGDLDHLANQPGAVRERSPIGVAASVDAGREKLQRQIIVTSIDIDDIGTGAARPRSRFRLPTKKGADVGLVHRPGRSWSKQVQGLARWRDRRIARESVVAMKTAVPELDGQQAAVFVYGIGSDRKCADIILVPQREIGKRKIVR